MKAVLAEIITIGDEILFGQIVDTNSAWMGTELTKIGIRVKQITSVSDSPDHIVEALDSAKTRADIILITGGLGPTKDDLTKHVLAEYFHTTLKLHEPSLADVTAIFEKRGRALTALNRQQAFLPESCMPVRNVLGTAPGMWFEQEGKVFVSMPGVPFEMKRMMTDIVLPQLKAYFKTPEIIHKVVQTVGIPESILADKLEDWENSLPSHLKLAYLPHLGGVRLRLTGTGSNVSQLEQELQAEVDKLQDLIPDYIFAYGEVKLEEAVGQLLKSQGLTLATAESCTGGYLAHRITSVAGSSAYFQGSVIAYHNEVKTSELNVRTETLQQHGAVSEATVREMAENVRQKFKTDIGVATSGIAGPGGGSPDKPVGTIWIAYADKNGTRTKLLHYNKDRLLNIEYTALAVLNLIRQSLTGLVEE
ncbi:competence/damage-inducible protein cinA [Pontibacter ummariensis]|uniref:CinA-like protein n=1 Tax=Pontibacter ummariensis TaxID=1610492 RepID=A0A239EHE3_9BACT|nr:competence/damage-inducible protein A [Pontibacter ummariensis]PRY13262.1 competence/damage-inducible protein cinA [Pontibacter ummariensis]SNS44057.1 competence/damage-inducible protein cinA [Pontibacter ummariensis]